MKVISSLLIIVITIIIDGCATNNSNNYSTSQIETQNMATVFGTDFDVFFQIENKRFFIKQVTKEIPDELAKKYFKDNAGYYCVHINIKGYSVCRNSLKNDIYLSRQMRDAGGVVAGVVTLPIAAGLDVLSGLSNLTPNKSRKVNKNRKTKQSTNPYEVGSNTLNSS